LTDKRTSGQTKSQTDITDNNATLATLHCVGGNDTKPSLLHGS